MPEVGQSSRRTSAYLVHFLTASGGIFALLALKAITENSLKVAFTWMALAVVVDSVDGLLARKVSVQRRLPEIDGALLDMIIDFANYVLVPAFLFLETDILPATWRYPLCFSLLLVSSLQFSHKESKTEDNYFRGFPSYWNILAFYLVLLGFAPVFNALVVLFFVALTPLPLHYIYPSKMKLTGTSLWQRYSFLAASILWGLSLLLLLLQFPNHSPELVLISLSYVLWYFAKSFIESSQRKTQGQN